MSEQTMLDAGATRPMVVPRRTRPADMGAGMRVLRVTALALLLCGSLLPPVAGIGIHVLASIAVAPLVVYEILRYLPRIAPVVVAALVVFGPLLIGGTLNPPVGEYGIDKWSAFTTSSLLSGAAVAIIRDARHLVSFAKVWVVISVVLAATTLQQSGVVERAGGYAESPIWMGRALGLGVVCALWLMWQRHVPRAIGLLAALIFVAAIVATGSRGPFLGMVAAVLALSLVISHGRLRRLLSLLAVAFLALVLAPSIASIRDSRLYQVFQTLGDGRSDQIREQMWSRSWQLLQREPSGVGVGSWQWEAPSPTSHRYPHNIFLEVGTEMGVLVGVALLVTVVLTIVRLAWLARQHAGAALVLALLVSEGIGVSVSGDMTARTFFAMITLGVAVTLWPRYSRPRPRGTAVRDLWSDGRSPTAEEAIGASANAEQNPVGLRGDTQAVHHRHRRTQHPQQPTTGPGVFKGDQGA